MCRLVFKAAEEEAEDLDRRGVEVEDDDEETRALDLAATRAA